MFSFQDTKANTKTQLCRGPGNICRLGKFITSSLGSKAIRLLQLAPCPVASTCLKWGPHLSFLIWEHFVPTLQCCKGLHEEQGVRFMGAPWALLYLWHHCKGTMHKAEDPPHALTHKGSPVLPSRWGLFKGERVPGYFMFKHFCAIAMDPSSPSNGPLLYPCTRPGTCPGHNSHQQACCK